ncbi:MAG: outer membrane protein assembly factor BamE [Burkholderiaceae bacterium]
MPLSPHSARALCAVLSVVALAGCASKNPLIDDPAVTAAEQAKAREAADTSGVQVVKQKRLFGIFTPYRIDIQQGNFVSEEMLAQVRDGMTRDQVLFALGTPLLTDIFHADRWDYPFRLRKGSGEIITSRVTMFFSGNRLVRHEGGNLPTEADYLALLAGGKLPKNGKPPAMPTGTFTAPLPH